MLQLEQRFWSKVQKGDGCWHWLACTRNGYGVFGLGRRVDGVEYAHRVSYRISRGVDPGEFHVCHSCDNPRCVNPDHLFLGTRADNMADAFAKGRLHPPVTLGENNGNSKLTAERVAEAKERCARGESRRSIARAFGVTHRTISLAVTGETWRPRG